MKRNGYLISEEGSSTVFLAVIFMVFLMLTGTMIDIARILSAEKKVSQALNTATRSVLAGYDADLAAEYGVFGVNMGSDRKIADKEICRYLKANLEEHNRNVTLVRYKVVEDKTSIEGMGSLVNSDVLKQQMLEYIKYKAPVTITENLIELIKNANIGEYLQDATDTTKDLKPEEQENKPGNPNNGNPSGKNKEDPGNFFQLKGNIEKLLANRVIRKEQLIPLASFEDAFDDNTDNMEKLLILMEPDEQFGKNSKEQFDELVIRQVSRLLDTLENATISGRDKIYTIEYVMDKFTFLTSKTERDRYFNKGEIEYIICGDDRSNPYNSKLNQQSVVIARVISRIWLMRYAVDALDRFANSKIPEVRVRLAKALLLGFKDSCNDMGLLLKGERIPITPQNTTGVTLRYSDHLRILLLMTPEKTILRRTAQLMQVNIREQKEYEIDIKRSDFCLIDYKTRLKVHTEVEVNLYFLPLMQLDKLYTDRFHGGKYIVRKEIYMGY